MKDSETTNDRRISLIDRILRCQPKLSYIIAIFDFIQAVFFTAQATKSIILLSNFYTRLALGETIVWVLADVLLLVGLWKCRPRLVKCWLIFSAIGLVTDIAYFLWSIIYTVMVDWAKIMEFGLLYLGIVFEFFCFYLVYKYQQIMDPCCLLIIEDGKKCPLDVEEESETQKRKQHKEETKETTENSGQQEDQTLP